MELFYDLHLHSCLSPCAGDDMTPHNLAAMCRLAGLDVVALTDHNTAGNCRAFCAAAEKRGLLALPGLELTTAEEVHVMCLFSDLVAAEAFGAYVGTKLLRVENDKSIFGGQYYMDERDAVLWEEPRLLSVAAGISVYEVAALVRGYGGAAYPAHIDRASFSLLANLGRWDAALGFSLAERSWACPPERLRALPGLASVGLITGSDAHELDQIQEAAHSMQVPERSARAVLRWIERGAPQEL